MGNKYKSIELEVTNLLGEISNKIKNRALIYYHYNEKKDGGKNEILRKDLTSKPLELNAGDDFVDFVSIKLAPGHYKVKEMPIVLPAKADFEFIPGREMDFTISHYVVKKEIRAVLTIPEGPPTWELKIKCPTNLPAKHDPREQDNVTIGDIPPGGGG